MVNLNKGIILKISKKKSLHIAFSYPYGNGFDPAWVESLTGLLLYEVPKHPDRRILGSILKQGSCYIDFNRDAIAHTLVEKSTDDWVVMVDPDIKFNHNILELFANHILANPKVRVIAGRVNLLNGFPVFYKGTPAGPKFQPFAFEGLREFDLVGTGIICIHREVFIAISKEAGHGHYFQKIISSEGMGIGDDFSFCMRAKRAGFKLYGAWDIFGQHWKPQPCPHNYPELNQL